MPFFGQGIDSHHIGLQKIVLVLYLVSDQVLELLHFNLHNDVVNFGLVAILCTILHWVASKLFI